MPRETINDEAGMYNPTVEWVPDKFVQVGIATADGRPIPEHLREPDGDDAGFTSLWGTLDRAEVNQLIQVLRRARNQAFGEDA